MMTLHASRRFVVPPATVVVEEEVVPIVVHSTTPLMPSTQTSRGSSSTHSVIVEVPYVYRGRFERAVSAVESDTGAHLTVLGSNRETGLCPILVKGPVPAVDAARERLNQVLVLPMDCSMHCYGNPSTGLVCVFFFCFPCALTDLAGRHGQPHGGGTRGPLDCQKRLVYLCG
jgi:hypothetical protein